VERNFNFFFFIIALKPRVIPTFMSPNYEPSSEPWNVKSHSEMLAWQVFETLADARDAMLRKSTHDPQIPDTCLFFLKPATLSPMTRTRFWKNIVI
jgi:hypothetical protein